jgi:hypothetical protein
VGKKVSKRSEQVNCGSHVATRTCLAVAKVRHPEVLVCGIDERDKRRSAVKTQPGLLVVRAGAASVAKVVQHLLDLLVRPARQRLDPTREQLQHVSGNRVVKGRDCVGEQVPHQIGSWCGRCGARDHLLKELLHDNGQVVGGVRYGGIAEVAWGRAVLARVSESPKETHRRTRP